MKTLTTQPTHFKPAKNIFYPLSFAALNCLIVLIIYFNSRNNTLGLMEFAFILFWFLSISYNVWVWKTTGYNIQEGQLYYRSGLTKGQVPISSIRKIETNSRAWGNIFAALTYKGCMITYNKWDEIFIAPKEQEEFLQQLLAINPEIEIKEHHKAA